MGLRAANRFNACVWAFCEDNSVVMDSNEKEEIRQITREALGIALRAARNETGPSQERFADAIGLDRTTISLLERGKQSATVETIWILCERLEVTPSELIARVEKLMVF